MPAISVRTPNH
uniref:Uncharacterized protein n=1 Tax=Romanomermis culicivorax TaxID=13658 RepID=A0A915KHT6_ROMCU